MKKGSAGRYIFKLFLFFLYIVVMTYILFFAEGFGRSEGTLRYNFVPFREIMRYINYRDVVGDQVFALNIFGNILLFVPLGFFIPALFTGDGHYHMGAILLCFVFSSSVEIIQLYTRLGSCDVDDIILNTLGGIIGYILYRIYSVIRRGYG